MHITIRTWFRASRAARQTGTPSPPGSNERVGDSNSQRSQGFLVAYEKLRQELLTDPLLENQPKESVAWMRRMLDYNVPLGKLNRGMAVADVYQAVTGSQAADDNLFRAQALGWCIEFLQAGRCEHSCIHDCSVIDGMAHVVLWLAGTQAFFLVADDIMDNSVTRRGQPCWYKRPEVCERRCASALQC